MKSGWPSLDTNKNVVNKFTHFFRIQAIKFLQFLRGAIGLGRQIEVGLKRIGCVHQAEAILGLI